ncbi:MAG: sulfite exporter TauE/SafE family protein [Acidimicrobiia bacterium]
MAEPSRSISPARVVGVGVTGGLLSGFFGVGGGIVMVPLLIWLLRVDRHTAHATSLAAIFVIAISGALTYGLAGSVDLGVGLALGIGGLAGAYAGAQLMHRLSSSVLRIVFAVVLVAAGLRMLVP